MRDAMAQYEETTKQANETAREVEQERVETMAVSGERGDSMFHAAHIC